MFDIFQKSKIESTKIQNRKLKLSSYRFDVVCQTWQFKVAADALRIFCMKMHSMNKIMKKVEKITVYRLLFEISKLKIFSNIPVLS